MKNVKEKLTGADKLWGFRFGEDGVISVNEAMAILSIGRTKIYNLFDTGKIRRGKIDRKTVICRKSIHVYLGSVEF